MLARQAGGVQLQAPWVLPIVRGQTHFADGGPGSLPHVPVRQWVLSLPIALHLLLAAQPKLLTPVLQVVHRAITRFLLDQAGLKTEQADSGALTLPQRFGSAANLSTHPQCGSCQASCRMSW